MTLPPDQMDDVREALERAGIRAPMLEAVGHGRSGDRVIRADGAASVFVKIAANAAARARLARETAGLRWLAGRVRVPAVLWSGPCAAGEALVMEALPGMAVSHVAPEDAVAALGEAAAALAALHALPVGGCPFDARLQAKLAEAAANVRAGAVEEDDFDSERLGRTAESLLAEALARRPASEDLVVTHGDASLPNFVWSPGGRAGLIDLGRLGVADRYQDLALFLRSAAWNHPQADAVAVLKERYGLAEADEALCAYYRLLDEFF